MKSTILITIQSAMETCTKREKILGQYILDNISEIPNYSVGELAEKSGVSPATVVRFSRTLGLDGFSNLKIELAKNSAKDIENGLFEDIQPEDNIEQIQQKLPLRIQESLVKTNELLDSKALMDAIKLFENNSMILSYGYGESSIAALNFTNKFSQIGKMVINNQDRHLMSTYLLMDPQKKVLFLISSSGESKSVLRLAQIAHNEEISIVSLTSNKNSSLAKISNIVILSNDMSANKGVSSDTTKLIDQIYIVNLMYFLYLQRNNEK